MYLSIYLCILKQKIYHLQLFKGTLYMFIYAYTSSIYLYKRLWLKLTTGSFHDYKCTFIIILSAGKISDSNSFFYFSSFRRYGECHLHNVQIKSDNIHIYVYMHICILSIHICRINFFFFSIISDDMKNIIYNICKNLLILYIYKYMITNMFMYIYLICVTLVTFFSLILDDMKNIIYITFKNFLILFSE
jgi:hypothetical protein